MDENSQPAHRFVSISLTICLLIIFFSVMLFYIVYKRKMKKGFSSQLQNEINKALNDFYKGNENEHKFND